MAATDRENQNPDDQLDDQLVEGEEGYENQGEVKERSVPAWIISLVLHVAIMGIFSLIVMAAEQAMEEEAPPVNITKIDPPPKKKDDQKMERTLENTSDLPLDVDVPADKPSPIAQVDVPVTEFSREEENDNPVPKGREEAIADSEMGGPGAFMAIGAGSGASGMFGSRSGGGKARALGRFGGSKGGENAVDAALRWFKKHQSPNGQWSVKDYPNNCTENPKCEPGTAHTDIQGDVACSGYALLCFLGAGYDHKMPSKYKNTVKKGIDWLVSTQAGDGLIGNRNYEHAVATMALAEAYAMSNDPALKDPAQRGVNVILSRQTPDPKNAGGYGLGWNYVEPNAHRNDSSVSGWNVMALKSAAAAGLTVNNGMEGAKEWLKRAWEATNKGAMPNDPYGESRFPYTWAPDDDSIKIGKGDKEDLAPVGALCSVFLGHHQGDLMLETLCNYIINNQMPKSYPTNTYYMYYNTLAIFQAGGDRWQKWNSSVRDLLISAQKKSQDCFDGSWDFEGTKFIGYQTGRLLSTAYCCLCLEVYYRYLPVGQAKGAAPAKP